MGGLFTELLEEREKQRKQLTETNKSQESNQTEKQAKTQSSKHGSRKTSKRLIKAKDAHKFTYLSKDLSKKLSTEQIETFVFHLRNEPKTRVNTDVPIEWKEILDSLALKYRVGKYELVMYIIALFLGKTDVQPE